jgi:fermentation-respiration switch protein FrsA (DUF1100 family)
MQIRDLDYYRSTQLQVMGGLAPKAIASGGATAIAFGSLTLTRTFSLAQTSTTRFAVSTGSATALSISSPNKTTPNASGVLASGRATVSSSGTAQS